MMSFNNRKSSYKLPPTTIRDKLVSQEARRNKALEEQKRRRAQKFDSARQLDRFADLTLGASDDEDGLIQEEEAEEENKVTPGSVARYAAMLQLGYIESDNVNDLPNTSRNGTCNEILPTTASPFTPESVNRVNPDISVDNEEPTRRKDGKKKRSGGGRHKRRAKASKWADRCMYAELLEMSADDVWDHHGSQVCSDGLPSDLETGWVAVAPVPAGKRCLAVTHQSAGVAGVVPNTTLRSRLLGKTLIARFPSALPPMTVLDCILDNQWRENGILHVLDVVRWKGQDVADCEARFRFWWRDTRLAELSQTAPPSSITFLSPQPGSSSALPGQAQTQYLFPYPTTFLPVPYHTDTALTSLDNEIIPFARTWREINVSRLISLSPGFSNIGMNLEAQPPGLPSLPPQRHVQLQPQISLVSMPTQVQPDGMLLYVAEASYESGTSPLSSWIPIRGYDADQPTNVDVATKQELVGTHTDLETISEGPLDTFQRLVKKRISRLPHSNSSASSAVIPNENVDVEMSA